MTRTRQGRWASRPAAPPARDGGSATVELAVSLPALVLLLFVALSAVMAVRTQLECVDAAREAARTAARGATTPTTLPAGAALTMSSTGDQVRATVRVQVWPLGSRLPSIRIEATSVAAREPGVDDG